jgi:predicted cobalt transporter CbtA
VLADVLAGIGFALVLIGAVALARLGGYTIDARRGGLGCRRVRRSVCAGAGHRPAARIAGDGGGGLAARQQWWSADRRGHGSGSSLADLHARRGVAGGRCGADRLAAFDRSPGGACASTGVPAELAAEFAIRLAGGRAAFWLLLGSVSGWLYRRFE